MSRSRTIGRILVVVFVASLALEQRTDAVVLPQGSEVEGKTIAEWSAEWWNWALGANAADTNPIADETGAFAGNHQSGPVFFVAGTGGQNLEETPLIERNVSVPEGKHLLIPLVNIIGWLDQTEVAKGRMHDEFYDEIRGLNNAVTEDDLHFSLNGQPTTNLKGHSEEHLFPGPWGPDPLFGPPNGEGVVGDAITLGYWLMLEPLPVGQHTLEYGGGFPAFTPFGVNVLANIVVPEPTTIGLLGVVGLGFCVRRCRRWPSSTRSMRS